MALRFTAATAIAASVATAFAASATATQSEPTAGFPVTITSCGASVTYTQPPKRAVTTDVNMIEDMLTLGLGSRVAGTFGVSDATDEIGAPYRSRWDQLKHVSGGYPDLEPLIALKPDFLFSGWDWGLDQSKNITPTSLAAYGIKTYSLAESCDYAPGGTTQSTLSLGTDTYTDLLNLGRIFGVLPKAEQVVNAMKAKVADVQKRVKGTKSKTVFLYDSGQAAPDTAAGLSMPQALITLAGGTNIFANLKRSWIDTTWEAVVAAKPDCILLNNYGTGANPGTTAAWKEKFLKTSPLTKNLPAVKNNCIMALNYDQLVSGPRDVASVEAIARWLHPEAFR